VMVLVVVGFVGVMIITTSGGGGKKGSGGSGGGKKAQVNDGFVGDAGETATATGDQILIDEAKVKDGNLHAFNYFSERAGKNIYFFVVQASDGTYRAAANACEVCYDSKKGFTQVGDQIRCENCRTMYTKDQIAMQKGGCNPRPIDKNVTVSNGQLGIKVADVEASADLF